MRRDEGAGIDYIYPCGGLLVGIIGIGSVWFPGHACVYFIAKQDVYPAQGIPYHSVVDDASADVARRPGRCFLEGVAVAFEFAYEVGVGFAGCPGREEYCGVDYFDVDSEGLFVGADEGEQEAEVASVGD